MEHELQAALASSFAAFSGRAHAKYLDLVRRGPAHSKAIRDRFGDEWNDFVRHWQASRLAPVFEHLTDDDRVWAATLLDEADIPDLLEPRHLGAGFWVGPTSPVTKQDMETWSIDELLDYLGTWEPSGDWASPSREGLARALAEAVEGNPRRFAASARRFIGQDPEYVRAVLAGLRTAIAAGSRISWRAVMAEAAEWVTDQSLEPTEPDWRRSIAIPDGAGHGLSWHACFRRA